MKRNAAWPLGVAHEGRFVPCAGNNGGVAQDHPGSAGHETAGAWHARAEGKEEGKAHHVDGDGQVLKVRKRHAGRGVLHIRAAVQGLCPAWVPPTRNSSLFQLGPMRLHRLRSASGRPRRVRALRHPGSSQRPCPRSALAAFGQQGQQERPVQRPTRGHYPKN